MAKINGIEYKTLLVGENSTGNGPQIQWGGLYLSGKKIATVLAERDIPGCEPVIQLFMMYGYSEKALRAALCARHGEDYTPDSLVSELLWLHELEKEFNRHLGSANGGMIVLNFENSQVNMGIPLRFAEASDEEILAALDQKIKTSEEYYGPFQSYLIFHTQEDFSRDEAIPQEELLEKE